ncbi:MAG: peptidase M16 [Alphaproteobacteria bacterium CG_4_10_14_0_8_um_filter_37_21]|nr:MAG: peptidase M16 [Alphaproteobacteria bacterium CG_4_10_14_0_8_um_filter_37_21]
MKKISTLSNGLRIATDYIPHVETVSLGVWFNVGSSHEEKSVNGISHVLEHMAFKGTQSRSALQISETIESVGGYLNAYTSRETTAYYARVLKEHTDLAVDILGDILQNSVFEKEELDKEKKVILQEIAQSQDTPDDVVFDYFQSTCYPDQALGRSILGPAENVMGFSHKQVKQYMQDHYSTNNMIFAAAGNIDHDSLVHMIENSLKSFPTGSDLSKDSAIYKGGDYRKQKDLEQAHIVIGFKGKSLNDDDYYTQMLAATMLGGGMSSRLFQEVREKRGLVYTISAFAQAATDSGIFGIYAGTGADQTTELLPVIAAELNKARCAFTLEELGRAKAQIKASLLMGLESTSHRCERMANHMLYYGNVIETTAIVKKIEAMDLTHIHGYMDDVLSSVPTLASLGPVQNVMDYDQFKKLF